MSRDPVPLSVSLDGVVRGLRGPGSPEAPAAAIGSLFGRWDEAVGVAVARHAQPVKWDGETVTVEVDEPAWAVQLGFLEGTLRERLAAVAGVEVTRFEVRVRRR